jgi:hypothetical protein
MKRHFLDFLFLMPPHQPLGQQFFALLKEHPHVSVLKAETHFFSSQHWENGLDWYEAQFSDLPSGRKRGEISTSYLITPGVPVRISREYPDAKLVVLLVNPLEAITNRYLAAYPDTAPVVSLEAWLEKNPAVLEQHKYGRLLAPFFRYYSPVDLMVITLEDIRKNAGAMVEHVFDHLGIDRFVPKDLQVLVEDEKKFGFWARRLRLDRWYARRRARRIKIAQSLFPGANVVLSAREQVLLSRYYAEDCALLSSLLHRNMEIEWGLVETPVSSHPPPKK